MDNMKITELNKKNDDSTKSCTDNSIDESKNFLTTSTMTTRKRVSLMEEKLNNSSYKTDRYGKICFFIVCTSKIDISFFFLPTDKKISSRWSLKSLKISLTIL